MLSYVWNHRLAGGFHPFAFHLTNVLLHGLNAILLWRLLATFVRAGPFGNTFRDALRPLLIYGVPLLFLTSPIETESVAYISSRSEFLSVTFYLLALLVFASSLRETRPWTARVGNRIFGRGRADQAGQSHAAVRHSAARLSASGRRSTGGSSRRIFPPMGCSLWGWWSPTSWSSGRFCSRARRVSGSTGRRICSRSSAWFFCICNCCWSRSGSISTAISLRRIRLGSIFRGWGCWGSCCWWALVVRYHRRFPVIAFGALFFFVTLAPSAGSIRSWISPPSAGSICLRSGSFWPACLFCIAWPVRFARRGR